MSNLNLSLRELPGQSQYGKLALALRERIVRHEWLPGTFIPAESSLAQTYGVALGTIRQAIAILVEDGLLQRQQGKGTLVKKGLNGASMMRFFRFRGIDDDETVTPQSFILSNRIRTATKKEIQYFGLPDSAQILSLERIRSLGNEPCLLESIALPLPLFGNLADSDTHNWDDLLYPIHKTQDHLSFSQLNSTQAKRLNLPVLHPCVLVERQAYDMSGRCVELRTTRGDAFAFKYTSQIQ
jgi:GntR family transcriptional regulator